MHDRQPTETEPAAPEATAEVGARRAAEPTAAAEPGGIGTDLPVVRISTASPDLLARLLAGLAPNEVETESEAALAADVAPLLQPDISPIDGGPDGAPLTPDLAAAQSEALAAPMWPQELADLLEPHGDAEPATAAPDEIIGTEATAGIDAAASEPVEALGQPAAPQLASHSIVEQPASEPARAFRPWRALPVPPAAMEPPAPPSLVVADAGPPTPPTPPTPFALRPGEPWLASTAKAAAAAREVPAFAASSVVASGAATAASDVAAIAPPVEAASAADQPSRRRDYRALARQVARYTAIGFGVWMLVTIAAIALFRFVDPPASMLMLSERLTGGTVDQRWVPLGAISPQVVRAVVASEDSRFCQHWGIDPQEIAAAIERSRNGIPRGASTITMQVAKNLFLWPSKSYIRKALEVPLTLAIEVLWSKARILEVYLNIAEWGPGVYGIEAAARHHFNKPAKGLSRSEAALLAVALPNPIRRDAGEPGAGTQRLGRIIEARMLNDPGAANCVIGRGR